MIPLQKAKENHFLTATRKELMAYATELGIDTVPPNANAAMLRKMVCSSMGIALDVEGSPAPMPEVRAAEGGDSILPSYNLTPNGVWGGRRHRISIPRPEGMKIGQAEQYNWNGKHPYWIVYDEVDSVPEPIYNIIAQTKRPIHKSTRPEGGSEGELTTRWEFAPAAITYLGVDEETRQRAGSLLEYYRARGTKWIRERNPRQLQQVARLLEVSTRENMGEKVPPRILSHEEILAKIMEFLYGYADAEVEARTDLEF